MDYSLAISPILTHKILQTLVLLLIFQPHNNVYGVDDHHQRFNKITFGRKSNDKNNNNKVSSSERVCDMSQGNWIYDESYPLYNTSKCPFIEKEFDCLQNGRPDKLYLKLRWKPSSCNLPRFNGQDLLRRFRGKSIMFVGDSLSLNQWQSLTCMLYTADPQAQYKLVRVGGLSIFSFPAYDVKVMLSRNAFLVDIINTSAGNVLQLDSIQGGAIWKDVDLLIFNTWHWWLHVGRKQPWDWIQDGDVLYKDMDRLVAYEKALNTWAKWVETYVDSTKTRVFFQGVSPDHNNASDWGETSARSCGGQARALNGVTYKAGSHPAEMVVERVLGSIRKKVYLLNVTALSQLRKDGHPSFYGFGGHREMDCSHWCLPGVPDTWNVILYSALLQSELQ